MSTRVFLFILAVVFQLSCSSPAVDNTPAEQNRPAANDSPQPPSNLFRDKIAGILQDGWDVTQKENIILVTRREPVTLYNNIALPPPGPDLKRVLENGERVQYEIKIEIRELVSKAKFREMAAVNEKTDHYLRIKKGAMKSSSSKGEYRPKTEHDTELYSEYQQQLQELPYYRLPDLYDAQNSYYITTPRSRRESFSYAREERECRGVLENIYSFAEAYEDFNQAEEDGSFEYPYDQKVDKVFISDRDYDDYVFARNQDLPKSQ